MFLPDIGVARAGLAYQKAGWLARDEATRNGGSSRAASRASGPDAGLGLQLKVLNIFLNCSLLALTRNGIGEERDIGVELAAATDITCRDAEAREEFNPGKLIFLCFLATNFTTQML